MPSKRAAAVVINSIVIIAFFFVLFLCLSVHNGANKVLVIDIAVGILVTREELFNLDEEEEENKFKKAISRLAIMQFKMLSLQVRSTFMYTVQQKKIPVSFEGTK